MAEYAEDMLINDDFISSVYNALADYDGILVSQMGEDDTPDAVPHYYHGDQFNFIETMASQDFDAIRIYSEAHCNFFAPWKFAIAFKENRLSMMNFYNNQAETDYAVFSRGVETNDGSDTPFKFFDGALLQTYQFSSRVNENLFCLTKPTPLLCDQKHGYDPDVPYIPITSLEVRTSTIEGAGRGVFFKEDFAKGTYISIDDGVQAIMFMPKTTEILKNLSAKEFTRQWKTFDYYTFGYGFSHDYFGLPGFSVDPNVMTFINHGCNGTYIMTPRLPFTELDADPEKMPEEIGTDPSEASVYNIFVDRNIFIMLNANERLMRSVHAGEELLDNYLLYLSVDNWKTGLLDYKTQCLKQAQGAIGVYEQEGKKQKSETLEETTAVSDK
jgi:hypothetical protein